MISGYLGEMSLLDVFMESWSPAAVVWVFFFFFFLMDFIFQNSFRFTTKFAGGTETCFLPHTCVASTIISIPQQSDTFVIVEDSMLTHCNHLAFIIYIMVPSQYSTCLDKSIMTDIHYCSIIQSSFTALTILMLFGC